MIEKTNLNFTQINFIKKTIQGKTKAIQKLQDTILLMVLANEKNFLPSLKNDHLLKLYLKTFIDHRFKKIYLKEVKGKKVQFKIINNKEKFLFSMLMRYQDIVRKQIQIFLNSMEEDEKRKKEDEKYREKIRSQILYEVRQHFLKKSEIEKNQFLHNFKKETISYFNFK